MKGKRGKVRISVTLAAEIDALVGRRKRSAFVIEIARRELEKIKALRTQEPETGEESV